MLNIRLPISKLLTPNQIYAELGSIAVLRQLPAAKVYVLISKDLLRNEQLFSKINNALKNFEVCYIEKPTGEPTQDMIHSLLKELVSFNPDWIIAIGGGSVLDCAKLLWVYFEHPEIEEARLLRPFGLPTLRGKAKFAAIPTTMGTGSEVSAAAIVHLSNGCKQPIVSHDLIPDIVILDPQLTLTTPFDVIVTSAMDALCHAIEGYVSKYNNPLLDIQAVSSAKIIFEILPKIQLDSENLSHRLQLQIAALMAGWVQNYKIPGISHALAHQLGHFGYSHGLACGLFLPTSIRINLRNIPTKEKYDHLASSLGMSNHQELIEQCLTLRQNVGLHDLLNTRLNKESIIKEQNILLENALQDPCARANPLTLDKQILSEALEMSLQELSIA